MAEFRLFSSLPSELRSIIWEKALPSPLGPQLYCYEEGCWGPRHLLPGDKGYEPDPNGQHIVFEFRHFMLDPVRIDVPLFFVNREAHRIAAAWMRTQGLRLELVSHEQGTFARPFDPEQDTLYVPPQEWNKFLREPALRPFESDLLQRHLDCPGVPFTRLAFSESMLEKERDPLPDIFCWYDRVKQIFVLRDPAPDLHPSVEVELQDRWEMHDVAGPACSWTGNELKWNNTGADGHGELYAKIEDMSKKAVPFLYGYGTEVKFEVWSATPVLVA